MIETSADRPQLSSRLHDPFISNGTLTLVFRLPRLIRFPGVLRLRLGPFDVANEILALRWLRCRATFRTSSFKHTAHGGVWTFCCTTTPTSGTDKTRSECRIFSAKIF